MLRMIDVCAGIGGASLAARITGEIEIIGQIERDPYCLKVLHKHWPDVPRIHNLEDFHGDEFGAIDIMSTSIPCQPFSSAGKRRTDADERHLWPLLVPAIRTARPRYFLMENVQALLWARSQPKGEGADAGQDTKGQIWRSIVDQLAAMGYHVGWCVYGACDVGAPHYRRRVFLMAYSGQHRLRQRQDQQESRAGSKRAPNTGETGKDDVAQPSGKGLSEWSRNAEANAPTGRTSADCGQTFTGMGRDVDGLSYWLDRYNWPAIRDEWPARPDQDQHEWEPPRTITGKLKNRVPRLKALGNAIVPVQMYPIFQTIVEIECTIENRHSFL